MIRVAVMDEVFSFIGYSIEEIKEFLGVSKLNLVDAYQALKYNKRKVFINTLATRYV